jgi:hypothetical protein
MMKNVIVAAASAVLVSGAVAPLAHADSGDQADAEHAVLAIYSQVQRGCTPTMQSHPQGITWDTFYPRSYGEGRIHDATPGLGGPFKVYYWNDRGDPAPDSAAGRGSGPWSVDLEFC